MINIVKSKPAFCSFWNKLHKCCIKHLSRANNCWKKKQNPGYYSTISIIGILISKIMTQKFAKTVVKLSAYYQCLQNKFVYVWSMSCICTCSNAPRLFRLSNYINQKILNKNFVFAFSSLLSCMMYAILTIVSSPSYFVQFCIQ